MINMQLEQGSPAWHQLRYAMVSGTRLKSAVGSPAVQKTLMNELIAAKMTEPQIIELNTPAVERGIALEPFAIKALSEQTGVDFENTGMLVSQKIKGFGFSPDGVVLKDGVLESGCEVKCPSSKKHVEYLLADDIPKEYYHQVMCPFLISDDVECWFFASYDDRNYERPLFVKCVTREYFKDLEQCREKLINFLTVVDDVYLGLTF